MSGYYYTVKDVAAIMGVHPSTVLDWIKRGYLDYERPWILRREDYPGYRITEQMVEDFKVRSANQLAQLAARAERKEREALAARLEYEEELRYWDDCFYEKLKRRI